MQEFINFGYISQYLVTMLLDSQKSIYTISINSLYTIH